jgi:phosphoenolpyruvate-protein phosphotransferase
MAEQLIYRCKLNEGIHARPAGHIERLCNTFRAEVFWKNSRTGITANAKSALALVGTDTLLNDLCEIAFCGEDEFDASLQLSDLMEKLLFLEEAVQEDSTITASPVPRTLRELHPACFHGTRICGGVAIARPLICQSISFAQLENQAPKEFLGEKEEILRFRTGINMLKKEKILRLENISGVERDIVEAHLSVINDITFSTQVEDNIHHHLNAYSAVVSAASVFSEILSRSASKYIRERVLDVMDITQQILMKIHAELVLPHSELRLTEPTLLIADRLSPGKFLALDKSFLAGLVLSHTGKTSHTAILARSLGIPTITDLDDALLAGDTRQVMVLDGNLGLLIPAPDAAVLRYYESELAVSAVKQQQMLAKVSEPALTADGHRLEVLANIGSSAEVENIFRFGAEGIGLYRTEMAFMDRPQPPSEEELFWHYSKVLQRANGKPVIFRTIDIGGDKPVEYLNIPEEENPFLGYRAIRIYPEFIGLYRTQLAAILRASAEGNAKIMIPMIASVEEVIWCRSVLEEVKAELKLRALPFNDAIEMGVMLEVPSVLFAITEIARHADFFSVGSNDLTQYLFAADRGNTRVEKVYDHYSPAFLRALKFAVDGVHREGRWIGICGELAADPLLLPVLAGLGFDELSMSASAIPAIKNDISGLSLMKCRSLVAKVLAAGNSSEVKSLLISPDMAVDIPRAILTHDCILHNVAAGSRNEVIKTLTDNLWLQGRTANREKLAEDIWKREDSFPTAVGFGFAIPHTKSDFISHSTISIAKLQKSVQWAEQSVNIVIMLTIRKDSTDNDHMKYFSRLARKIMNEDFRNEISRSETASEIYKAVSQAIDVEF